MMYSSLPANPVFATIDQEFLTNVANWERKSIQNICVEMSEVDRICQMITKCFKLKARP